MCMCVGACVYVCIEYYIITGVKHSKPSQTSGVGHMQHGTHADIFKVTKSLL